MNSKSTGDDVLSDNRLRHFDPAIPVHRALHQFQFPRRRLGTVLLLPLVFTLLAWPALKLIAIVWGLYFEFWMARLGMAGSVVMGSYGPARLNLSIPYVDVSASAPEATVWWGLLFLVVVIVAVSPLIPDRYLPLRYFVRLCAFILFSSLAFFVLAPGVFPYRLQDHLVGFETAAIGLMLVLPWIHAVIYYIFEFSLRQKILFTSLSLLLCSAITPFLLMIHAYLVYEYSLMVLPFLYFIFGILILIMACISMYGWAMSWEGGRTVSS